MFKKVLLLIDYADSYKIKMLLIEEDVLIIKIPIP